MKEPATTDPLAVDVLGLGFILVWVAVSVMAAADGDAAMFARHGALGVSVAVGYFATVRLFSARPIELYEARQWEQNFKQFAQLSDAVHASFINISVLAASLVHDFERAGNVPPLALKELAKPANLIARGTLNPSIGNSGDLAAQVAYLANTMVAAGATVKKQARFSEVFQAVVVVLATLQWGYGDLLLAHGVGI